MGNPVLIDQLADDIWNVYASDTANAETNIEQLLADKLNAFPGDERQDVLLRLIEEYESIPDSQTEDLLFDNAMMVRIFSLLLGKDVSASGLSNAELIQKLAESLNTIFDSMNLLITTINATLYGKTSDDRTIRHVIGSHLQGEEGLNSLEDHLKQVTRAFLTVQQSFKASAKATVAKILEEIDPDGDDAKSGGIHVGPFHKAKLYGIYKDKYSRIKKWYESDRFLEDFLREFEKSCEALTKHG